MGGGNVDKLMSKGSHPRTWDDFKGQDEAKAMLRRAAQYSQASGEVMDHVLIESPMPGIGKTSLALLLGQEMGPDTYVHFVSGDLPQPEFTQSVVALQDGDIIVIDEFHRVFQGGRGKGEYLLHYLQQGTLVTSSGGVHDDVPQVTIVATTTEVDRIPGPVLDRLTYKPSLQPYNLEQGAEIAKGMADTILGKLGQPPIDDATAEAIAMASASRPRVMQRLLRSIRDLTFDGVIDPDANGRYDITQALAEVNLTADGLTEDALAYLGALATHGKARPLGKQQIADLAGLAGPQVVEAEAVLMARGYLELARTGRSLSVAGHRRAMKAGLAPRLRGGDDD